MRREKSYLDEIINGLETLYLMTWLTGQESFMDHNAKPTERDVSRVWAQC